MNIRKFNWSLLLYVIAGLLFLKGLHQFYIYENFLSTKTNVYVGGDAYNYIINAVRSVVYFMLSGMAVIIGILLNIYSMIRDNLKKELINNVVENKEYIQYQSK
ncbi:hypothetical protein [Staphylococcus pseudintermedius]|uniref:hypothetical protein n=1 Tax=Staphylococcus pseudintermedius TaxID=283734 RepID=UPI0018F8BE4C